MPNTPIACQIDALDTEQREHRAKMAKKLREVADEVRELKDGYAFGYQLETITWMEIAEFINLESQCCPFFTFEIKLKPESNSVWLQLTGKKGTKEFLQTHEDFAV